MKNQLFLFEELQPKTYAPVAWKQVPGEVFRSWPFARQLEYSIARDFLEAQKATDPEWRAHYLKNVETFKKWLNEL